MTKLKAIINARLYDYESYHHNYYIIFDQVIESIGEMSEFDSTGIDEIINLNNNLVLPGFIAGHTHLYSAFARGMALDFKPDNFVEILEQLWWKLDHFLDKEMIYFSAYSFAVEQMLAGTTCLVDHHASNEIKGSLSQIKRAVVDDLGLRAILAFETSDRFDVNESIKENTSFIKTNKQNDCRGLFGMHASFTLSDQTLSEIKKVIGESGIHIHVAESEFDETDSLNRSGKSVVERLSDFGLINSDSILVHCTHASNQELELIKEKQAYVCVNVTSNMNNGVGLPDISAMDELGIKWFVGNDGLLSSMPIEYLNAYYATHLKKSDPKALSTEAIRKAIIRSYEYASKAFEVPIGQFKEGYVADFITVQYDEITAIEESNIFSHLFFGIFPNLKPQDVFVKGKQLLKDYQALAEIKEKLPEAKKQANRLWEIIEKEGKDLEFNY